MEPWWVLVLKVFGGPLVSGLVAAGITYWLSRRRFIGERWWDRKADAYGSIIGGLVRLMHSLDVMIQQHGYRREFGGEDFNEAYEASKAEYDEIVARLERTVTEGDYVISRKAASALSGLVVGLATAGLDRVPDFGDPFDDWLGDTLREKRELVRSSLEAIRAEAQSDLQVK